MTVPENSAAPPAQAAAPDAQRPARLRKFGRFELRELLGRSERTMAWRAHDPRVQQDLLIVMPRQQPQDAEVTQQWEARARKAARLDHPNLAHVVEVGAVERWPYVVYDGQGASTLVAHVGADGLRLAGLSHACGRQR
jgi:eukaryotic-like serine/threonine-protein kinase